MKPKEDEVEVECNICEWAGDRSDLVNDEEGECFVCPNCGTDDIYYF